MMRILPLALLLVLGGCSAAAGAPSRYTVRFRADAPSSRHVLPYPPAAVWNALPMAYADLQLPAGPSDRDRLEYTTPQLRVQNQLYGRRNSEFLDCGVVDQGRPLEDHAEVMLAMITRLEAAGEGGTAVLTQLDAYARRRDVASDSVPCTTRGVLEQALFTALLRRLQQGAPAIP